MSAWLGWAMILTPCCNNLPTFMPLRHLSRPKERCAGRSFFALWLWCLASLGLAWPWPKHAKTIENMWNVKSSAEQSAARWCAMSLIPTHTWYLLIWFICAFVIFCRLKVGSRGTKDHLGHVVGWPRSTVATLECRDPQKAAVSVPAPRLILKLHEDRGIFGDCEAWLCKHMKVMCKRT